MAWNPQLPEFPDQESRTAYRAGYSDGFYCFKHNAGDQPIQPYSRGYWEGHHDAPHDWAIDTPCDLVDTCRLCGARRA